MKVVFIMEYCSGGELLDYVEGKLIFLSSLANGGLDENDALIFFK